MEILAYEPSMLEEVASAYNKATAAVPHCHPVSAEAFAAALPTLAEEKEGAEQEGNRRLHSEAVAVAREGGRIAGLVHTALVRPGKEDEDEQGAIRFLWYERGSRKVGQALLEAAEDRLRERGMKRLRAFPQEYRYSFYHLKAAYLSDHLDHVQALLGSGGYERIGGEVFLDWPDFVPLEPALGDVPAEITVRREEGRGVRPGVKVVAVLGGKQIGECGSVSCGEYSAADEAQDWLFTTALDIEEPQQGKGLGRRLLRRALAEAHEVGYRHAAISTAWENYRAFLFYSNFGYHVVDWTYGYGKGL